MPRNDPGSWEFFLSQHQALGGDQANTLHHLLKGKGKTTWYDQVMRDRSEAALEEGVKHSKFLILFLTGGPKSADKSEGSETPEARAHLEAEGECYHIAMQAPQMLVGGGAGGPASTSGWARSRATCLPSKENQATTERKKSIFPAHGKHV